MPESWAESSSGAVTRYSPGSTLTAMAPPVPFARKSRTRSRARVRPATGAPLEPGFASFPWGETYTSAAKVAMRGTTVRDAAGSRAGSPLAMRSSSATRSRASARCTSG